MSSNQVIQMRDFILAAEGLARDDLDPPARDLPGEDALTEDVTMQDSGTAGSIVLEDLHEMVFRLRAFTEGSEGDYALGVEMGMQRAAEMIENLIRRHAEDV